MYKRQDGVTLLGFIIILIFVVGAAYIGMKLVPMYMEYYSIKRAFDTVAEEPGSSRKSPSYIRNRLDKLFNSSYVSSVKRGDIKISRSKKGVKMKVKYENRANVVANLDMVTRFQYEVILK